MPRRSIGPRLKFREDKGYWYIRDGQIMRGTGCARQDLEGAERALSIYIQEKHEEGTRSSHPDKVKLATVMNLYLQHVGPRVSRPKDMAYRFQALKPYWAERTVSEIRGETCRNYTKRRSTPNAARRELEDLRASVRWYHAEYGLDAVPAFTLPPKPVSRERWLTRGEVSQLIAGAQLCNYAHVARFVILGAYTGTRSKAILSLQWMPNTEGGWIDLENGVMHRRGHGERVAENKRRPPVRLPSRLIPKLERWREADKGLRYVVNWNGEPVKKLRRSWGAARKAGQLDADVTPHTLRHTCATWLMQAGVDKYEACGLLGMKLETLERTYAHHHPDYQKTAAEAL